MSVPRRSCRQCRGRLAPRKSWLTHCGIVCRARLTTMSICLRRWCAPECNRHMDHATNESGSSSSVRFASAIASSNYRFGGRRFHRNWFCTPSAPPFHGEGLVNGSPVRYIFLGNPNRCPTVAGPQFSPAGPTPNGSYATDVMVSNLAHAINGLVTNPAGTGWYDRYGLENGDKCQDALGHPAFGPTYLTANGARANVRMGGRDFLIQQNWVNDRKPRCAMFR